MKKMKVVEKSDLAERYIVIVCRDRLIKERMLDAIRQACNADPVLKKGVLP